MLSLYLDQFFPISLVTIRLKLSPSERFHHYSVWIEIFILSIQFHSILEFVVIRWWNLYDWMLRYRIRFSYIIFECSEFECSSRLLVIDFFSYLSIPLMIRFGIEGNRKKEVGIKRIGRGRTFDLKCFSQNFFSSDTILHFLIVSFYYFLYPLSLSSLLFSPFFFLSLSLRFRIFFTRSSWMKNFPWNDLVSTPFLP